MAGNSVGEAGGGGHGNGAETAPNAKIMTPPAWRCLLPCHGLGAGRGALRHVNAALQHKRVDSAAAGAYFAMQQNGTACATALFQVFYGEAGSFAPFEH